MALGRGSSLKLMLCSAGRSRVEDGLGIGVAFFHLDCLASELRRFRRPGDGGGQELQSVGRARLFGKAAKELQQTDKSTL